MLSLTIVLLDPVQQTFKSCFSPRSFLRGNMLTNQLTLNMIPFDHIDEIQDYNQCRTALDKMNVLAYLYFDDVRFPLPGKPLVYFKYSFNTVQQITFNLTGPDYLSIMNKRSAVFELRYDTNYVIVNSSVATIEHTKYNGTGCFQNIFMNYTIYGDLDIVVEPHNCQVNLDTAYVYFDYYFNNQNIEITIPACTANCVNNQYNQSASLFTNTFIYKLKRTVGNAALVDEFYSRYIENHTLEIFLNIKSTINGIPTSIKQFILNKIAVDTLSCIANDPPTDVFWGTHLYTIANPDALFVQVRDTLVNELQCNLANAKTVKVDHYLIQKYTILRQHKTLTYSEFSKQIGIQFDQNDDYDNFRSNVLVSGETTSLIVLSFLDVNEVIIYEISTYDFAHLGCLTKQSLQIYKNSMCAQFKVDQRWECIAQVNQATNKNRINIFYTQNNQTNEIGTFDFQQKVNYSSDFDICFDCDSFSSEGSCQEKLKLLKDKVKLQKGVSVGFFYCNYLDNQKSNYIVAQYQNIWVPFAVSAGLLVLLGIVALTVIFTKEMM
ncbi:Conserved_hypothetical protein [Hexamita inflata]|uniref:Transmembrane protein n=1 Tax=Hexamita inflata TaxID=28002 RepID=A0AA86PL90_9EUKA|nr:Conserved hypothetical protein [Hexamita inflata]